MLDLSEIFAKHDDEYLEFERVVHKLHARPDINAFLLLDLLVPGVIDIVGGARDDKIFLNIRPSELEEVATEEQVIDLIRCGVQLHGCRHLCMFT